jgi:hypothetical protein
LALSYTALFQQRSLDAVRFALLPPLARRFATESSAVVAVSSREADHGGTYSQFSQFPRRIPMSWLTRVRNSLSFGNKRETPEDLWVKCPSCNEMLFTKEYEENLFVCPRCEIHGRVGAVARLATLLYFVKHLVPLFYVGFYLFCFG